MRMEKPVASPEDEVITFTAFGLALGEREFAKERKHVGESTS
jgi:hypothetical protein